MCGIGNPYITLHNSVLNRKKRQIRDLAYKRNINK